MPSPPSSFALGAFLAAWLLCSCSMAGAAFTSPYILGPPATLVSSPAPRYEIRGFMGNRYRATLFIRTLLALQARPVTRLDSFTAIAAIHGSPTYFDGVTSGSDGANGYCVHSRTFFSPWHRPYLMMLEQAINEQARVFAAQYTTADKASYVAAARAMRVPYWDWGTKDGQVPAIFLQPNFVVTLPNGTRQSVRNPLNRYTIPTDAVSNFQLPTEFRSIFRSWTTPTATLGNIGSLRSGLVSMFKTDTFSCFSDFSGTGCDNTGALEVLHNELHGTIGGDGHMSYLSYAAFDPIFFLHHANVDRQLAIWEGIHPTVTMDSIADERAYPFRKTSTTWWTTRDLMYVYDTSKRGTRRFGYYYPEFANPAVTSETLLTRVDQLYNDFIGQARVILTLARVNGSPIDGTTTITIASNATAAAAATNSSSRAGTTRRTRKTVVTAGSVPIYKRGGGARRFTVSRISVDVTDALAKIKAANPNVTNVDIVATITPFDSNITQPITPVGAVVDLGKATISTVVDGQVVSSTTTNQVTPKARVAGPKAADVKLFAGEGNVKAVVLP